MNEMLEMIRAAVADGATDDSKRAGATACRTLLIALEANAGEPLTVTTPARAMTPLAAAVSALRHVPPDQILDLAVEKLRAAVAARTPNAPVAAPSRPPFHVQIVPLEHLRRTDGTR